MTPPKRQEFEGPARTQDQEFQYPEYGPDVTFLDGSMQSMWGGIALLRQGFRRR
jgi:hypothetical protein